MSTSAQAAAWMDEALALAAKGLCTTHPNPRVGCVIVKDGQCVGRGWHRRAGEPHAEVHALREAGDAARGATAYVTLEPCSHHGRTPPCADALIAAGVSRVVVAIEDPFPAVQGRGIERLRAAGIDVEVGVGATAAHELNLGFISRCTRQRPWVRLKLGMSLDGKIALADGRSQWITGAAARADVQLWRARSSAILTGIGTVRADDPRLTVRLDGPPERAPTRIVLDPSASLSPQARLWHEAAPLLWVHAPAAELWPERPAWVQSLAIPAPGGQILLPRLMAALAERGENEILVEAGPRLCGALLHQGLVDELLLYIAPRILGASARSAFELPPLRELDDAEAWTLCEQRSLDGDLFLRLRAPPPAPGWAEDFAAIS